MAFFDIVTLIIAVVFVIIGFWKGFLKTILKFGATLLALILSRLFGTALGNMILPDFINGDSALGERLSPSTLDNVNSSIAATVGTLLIFVVLFVIFRLIASWVSKARVHRFKSRILDKILGAIFGLVLSFGAIYAFAVALELMAVLVTLIAPSIDIYSAVENTVIFRHFF